MPANGMVEPMLSFFLPKVKNLVLLDEPHLLSDSISPVIEVYKGGKIKRRFIFSPFFYLPIYLLCKIPSKKPTRISYKLRDFFITLIIAFLRPEKYDLFIGFESINALAGIILKKIGKVKLVVYYVSDYSPTWFGKTFFNSLYLQLDRFCVRHADFTWDVSAAMKEGRRLAGVPDKYMDRVINVQNGLFPSQINPLPVSRRKKDSIVYMGILDKEMGIDLAVEAFNLVLLKRPHAIFYIIGGTEKAVARIKKIAIDLKIEKSIIFYGFLPPDKKMADIVRSCRIGLAPYLTEKSSRRRYGDPGKIRQYLGCGLPIVSTGLLWYAKHAVAMGAGVTTKDNPKALAEGILRLLEDKKFYEKCSENAISLSRDNTWENSYLHALNSMQKILNEKQK